MQKTIWITGASSGIGREFARRYAAMGCRLILTARRADRLQALAKELHAAHGTDCRIETADLSRAEECSRLCEVLADEHSDIFINIAGFGVCGSILETEEAREEEMIQVNVAAMARLFRAVVRKMNAQGGGTILNVASSAGLLPGGPYMAGYYASKAYVVSMTRGVAEELRDLRMERARELLAGTDLPLSEVGRAVGYPRPTTFATAFSREVGCSPAAWRKQHRL